MLGIPYSGVFADSQWLIVDNAVNFRTEESSYTPDNNGKCRIDVSFDLKSLPGEAEMYQAYYVFLCEESNDYFGDPGNRYSYTSQCGWDGFKSNGFKAWQGNYTMRVYLVNSAGATEYMRRDFVISAG